MLPHSQTAMPVPPTPWPLPQLRGPLRLQQGHHELQASHHGVLLWPQQPLLLARELRTHLPRLVPTALKADVTTDASASPCTAVTSRDDVISSSTEAGGPGRSPLHCRQGARARARCLRRCHRHLRRVRHRVPAPVQDVEVCEAAASDSFVARSV